MTKKLMSVAAMTALLSTGASAFDTNSTGDILTRNGTAGNYIDGNESTNPLLRSTNDAVGDRLKGDALIFPVFDMTDDWSTEIVLRNNLDDTAVLAKAVLYDAEDSRELVDFNIYLSQNDQTRFTIKNGKVTSTDDSIAAKENIDEDSIITMASEAEPFEKAVTDPLTGIERKKGYIIVYGMAQVASTADLMPGVATKGYHNKHIELFKFYRQQLDARRGENTGGTNSDWRDAFLEVGVYTDSNATIAPNITADTNLTGVVSTALSGYERIINPVDVKRDMRLNATALANFTDDNLTDELTDPVTEADTQIVLWAPGEYAAIADRDINGTGSYVKNRIIADTTTFVTKSATYSYNNALGNVSNRFIFTQPTKRFLVQLGTTTAKRYWTKACTDNTADGKRGLTTGLEWGFRGKLSIFNEAEGNYAKSIGAETVTSPRSSSTKPANCNELESLSDLELPSQDTDGYKNGFVTFDLTTGTEDGIPAIITQMSATKVDGDARINWTYAPATK